MSHWERRLKNEGFLRIAGVDEAGRGPLAGPVVSAACILHDSFLFQDLNDSKQLTPKERERLYMEISDHPGVYYGIGICDADVIDEINILQATLLSMQRAVAALPVCPDYLLVDGNRLPVFSQPAEAIIGGDGRSVSIAAASVLAKVTRDRMMDEFDARWPMYGFKRHKGYGTAAHLNALREFGPSPIHRKSFKVKC